jgi:hypothetical protein
LLEECPGCTQCAPEERKSLVRGKRLNRTLPQIDVEEPDVIPKLLPRPIVTRMRTSYEYVHVVPLCRNSWDERVIIGRDTSPVLRWKLWKHEENVHRVLSSSYTSYLCVLQDIFPAIETHRPFPAPIRDDA